MTSGRSSRATFTHFHVGLVEVWPCDPYEPATAPVLLDPPGLSHIASQSRGSPSTRSAITLRCTSLDPRAMHRALLSRKTRWNGEIS